MRLPLACSALVVFALAWPYAVARAQDATPKSPDVMTVNGVRVPAPAAVPDLTAPPRAEARRAAPRVFASRAEYEAALAELSSRDAAPKAGKRDPEAVKRPAPRPAAGSIPALLGPLPRPAWGAGPVPAEPKPADVERVGEPTGIETPPASDPPVANAKREPKVAREIPAPRPRDTPAPPPSPVKPEVKR